MADQMLPRNSDQEPCPDCEGVGGLNAGMEHLQRGGADVYIANQPVGKVKRMVVQRVCPTCNGTGAAADDDP